MHSLKIRNCLNQKCEFGKYCQLILDPELTHLNVTGLIGFICCHHLVSYKLHILHNVQIIKDFLLYIHSIYLLKFKKTAIIFAVLFLHFEFP